ncbi:MAG: ABC transporter permease [Methanomassiliicoccaceae archaeon]|jgi:ABC-2 type transport system permease protein|nr:ABC transporter permease [Methanomassiliicoccaceae archaeon]
MNHLWNLIRKELKELLTPASVISIVVVAVLFASLGGMIGSEVDKATELPAIGVINGDSGALGDEAVGYIEDYYGAGFPDLVTKMTSSYDDRDAIMNEMNDLGINIVLVIDSGFSDDVLAFAGGTGTRGGTINIFWSEVRTGVFGAVSTAIVYDLISYINIRTAQSLISGYYPGDAENVLSPVAADNFTVFNGRVFEGITPADISAALQSQSLLMPLLIMIVITMIGGMIISSMGNEKENKTLETLLTLPVKRTTIVSGKLIGSAIAGMIFGVVYLAGMYFYTSSMSAGGTVSLENLGLTLSLIDWTIVAAVIFLAILSALGICMILGAFVKNYKAAQTLTLPITVFAMIPMFVTMFADFSTLPAVLQVILFAIPFTHPMMIMNNLMLGNTFMVWAGLGYLVIFALLTIYITVRIYNSDILLTGLVKKKKDKKGILSLFTRRN